MTFSFFDILILAMLSISSLLGVYRGMIHITVNLLGFVASIVAAIFLYSYVRILFSAYVDNELVTTIASALTAYIISLIIFTIITSKVTLLFGNTSKGVLDRILGLVLGVLRGGVFSLVLFAIIAIFTAGTYSDAEKSEDVVQNLSIDKYPEWLKESTTTIYLEKALKASMFLVPEQTWQSIKMPTKHKEEDIIEVIKRRRNEDIKSSSEIVSD